MQKLFNQFKKQLNLEYLKCQCARVPECPSALQVCWRILLQISTAWKVSKYGVFSGPHLDTFHAGKTLYCCILLWWVPMENSKYSLLNRVSEDMLRRPSALNAWVFKCPSSILTYIAIYETHNAVYYCDKTHVNGFWIYHLLWHYIFCYTYLYLVQEN